MPSKKRPPRHDEESMDDETLRLIFSHISAEPPEGPPMVRRQARRRRQRVKRRIPQKEVEIDSDDIDLGSYDDMLSVEPDTTPETDELVDLFSSLRGGPDVIPYFNALPVDQRQALLKTIKAEMGMACSVLQIAGKKRAKAEALVAAAAAKPMLIRIMNFDGNGNLPSGLKLELLKRYFTPGSAPEKNMQWMETVLHLPFGRYSPNITEQDLASSQSVLDEAVYGHCEAKHKLVTYMAQLLRNQESSGLILGLRSYPGVGKTNLVDSGVSRILHRPFFSASLGGVNGSEYLRGFQYTFEGSEPGYMARCIAQGGVMNPVFFFDELDKISQTPHGDEIVNTLIQLTDALQSKVFQDRYLGSSATLDLSRCVFVFAYNDRAALNPILRDRITEIELRGFSTEDKLIIARDYMIPRIVKDIGFPSEQTPQLSDCAIIDAIEKYTNEAGVRHLKRVLSEVFMELNLHSLLGSASPLLPEQHLIVDAPMLERLITTYKPITIERTTNCQVRGRINGLFVDSGGCSGILPLEATWIPSARKASYEMRCTGNLGKVMGESTQVAWSVAWNLLKPEKQNEWLNLWHPEHCSDLLAARQSERSDEVTVRSLPTFEPCVRPARFDTSSPYISGGTRGCLHIHCRDNAMPKDGPSAGVALTVLMWSMLTDTPLPQHIAYTGEIGLHGELLPIGGLPEKLVGAHRAGCQIVVFPQSNIDHLPPRIPGAHDKSMQVIPLCNIQEVIALVLNGQREAL